MQAISIHAPRTGSDNGGREVTAAVDISIHAPRTGSDGTSIWRFPPCRVFQSTLPARGATSAGEPRRYLTIFQSTLPARGATVRRQPLRRVLRISIHAPRTGSDVFADCNIRRVTRFQSTLPARGATATYPARFLSLCHFNPRSPHGERRDELNTLTKRLISIHAPRTGSDKVCC